MADSDMRGQTVQNQYNADKIVVQSARAPEAQSEEQKRASALYCINATFRSAHRTLYGRGQELKELTEFLYRDKSIVAVQAIGGMGKTALGRECCSKPEVWESYEIILGAQAVKRQILIDTRAPRSASSVSTN